MFAKALQGRGGSSVPRHIQGSISLHRARERRKERRAKSRVKAQGHSNDEVCDHVMALIRQKITAHTPNDQDRIRIAAQMFQGACDDEGASGVSQGVGLDEFRKGLKEEERAKRGDDLTCSCFLGVAGACKECSHAHLSS